MFARRLRWQVSWLTTSHLSPPSRLPSGMMTIGRPLRARRLQLRGQPRHEFQVLAIDLPTAPNSLFNPIKEPSGAMLGAMPDAVNH